MGALIAVPAIAGLAACGNAGAQQQGGQDYPNLPADHVLGNITRYMTQGGIRRAELKSDSAYVFADSARAKLKKVHLFLYNEMGKEAVELTSRSGELDQHTNAMVARENVVLVARSGGQRVETEELHYDPTQHQIWSDVPSTIWQNGSRTETDGFSVDDQLKNYQMKRVRGTVQADKVTF